MTFKNNRAPLLCYFKLSAAFRSHRWIQTGVTVRKRPIWVEFDDFYSRATLKFDGWPCKTIGHLFYATSNFVYHSIPIGEFIFELQSGNAQFGSKSTIFFSLVTLKFDGWPSKTIGHLFYATSSFVKHFIAIGEFKLELQSGNAQSGSNSAIFSAVWPWNLTDYLEKQQGTCSKQHQAICIISPSYVNSNWSYSPETVKLGRDLCDLDLWPLTLNFRMDVTFVIGNNFWKFHDDTMMVSQTDRQTDGQNQSLSCLVAAKNSRLFVYSMYDMQKNLQIMTYMIWLHQSSLISGPTWKWWIVVYFNTHSWQFLKYQYLL